MSRYYGDSELFATPNIFQQDSHMIMTNVIKPTRVKYIKLDTRFADDYVNNMTNPSNLNTYNQSSYTFTLPELITNVKSITAQTAEIPYSFYTMSDYVGNNVMSIQFGNSAPIIIKVPEGNLSETQIQLLLRSAINGTGQLTYGYMGSGKFTITNKNTTTDAVVNFAIKPDGTFDKYNLKKKLGWLLGFRKASYIIPKSNGVIMSESVFRTRSYYFYLAIDDFSNGNRNSFLSQTSSCVMNNNILSKIVMCDIRYSSYIVPNAQTYNIVPANKNNGLLLSNTRTYSDKTDIQKLNIQLLDEFGDVVNLNGANYSVTLVIEYE